MAKTSAARPAAKKSAAARTSSKPAAKAAPKAVAAPAVKPVAKAAAKSASKSVARPAAKAAAKPPAKPPAKRAAKPAVKVAVKSAHSVKASARTAPRAAGVLTAPATRRIVKAATVALKAAPVTAARPTLVRDSFTMPEEEYAVLAEVKKACLKAGVEIKKSELLRIGVALVRQLDLASLQNVLASLPQLKTGRPRSE